MNRDALRMLARRLEEAGRRGLILFVAAMLCIPVFVLCVLWLVFVPLWLVVPLPIPLLAARALAEQARARALAWSDVRIPRPYRPEPAPGSGFRGRLRWVLGDPATWRDVFWVAANVPTGAVLGAISFGLVLHGVGGVVFGPVLWLAGIDVPWYAVSFPLGVVCLALAPYAGPYLQRLHAAFSAWLLAPSTSALTARVDQLTGSRDLLADASASELRRIERDLHDGPQARLATVGMSIGLAERVLRDDPEAAATLLADARASSAEAMQELRRLVRGIHPPVLAERGLVAAVEALALSLPVPVTVDLALPGPASAPIESALYYAVSEALANVVKHSGCSQAWLRLRYEHGRVVAAVTDDGPGGADASTGTGLAGVRNRLAAFDGTLSVSSPPGGPTTVTMEIPCASSSARTTPSSGTG